MSNPINLPPGSDPIFANLWNQVSSLHAEWTLYLELFSRKKDTDLLSDMAPAMFSTIEYSLRSNLIMAFGRLTDRASHGNGTKPNLCLERLVNVVGPPHSVPEFHTCLTTQLETIRDRLRPVIEFRNRTVGHADFSTASGTRSLPRLRRSDFEEPANLIAELLNCIALYFGGTETLFQAVRQVGTGSDLVYFLRVAKHALNQGVPAIPA